MYKPKLHYKTKTRQIGRYTEHKDQLGLLMSAWLQVVFKPTSLVCLAASLLIQLTLFYWLLLAALSSWTRPLIVRQTTSTLWIPSGLLEIQ